MIGEEIVGDRTVSLLEVKEILQKRKREGELKYEQENSLKYATTFVKAKKPQLKKLETELEKIPGINAELKMKILDILPKHFEVMQVLVEKGMEVEEESLKKAQELVSKIIYKE